MNNQQPKEVRLFRLQVHPDSSCPNMLSLPGPSCKGYGIKVLQVLAAHLRGIRTIRFKPPRFLGPTP